MTKRDSYLVKQIKKLEKIGDKANSNLSEYYFYKSPEGQMAEAIDHIHEVVHESLIRYDELKEEEKRREEVERFHEKQERRRKEPSVEAFVGLDKLITTNTSKSDLFFGAVKKFMRSRNV